MSNNNNQQTPQGDPSAFNPSQHNLNTSSQSYGATGTPHITTENVDDADSSYGPRYSMDDGEASILTRDSRRQLVGQNTQDNQYYPDYHQSSGFGGYFSPHKYVRQQDTYYDEEATRHNTLTSDDPNAYGFEHDYTDRDFPGGGKGARQSMTDEPLTMPEKFKKRRKCCYCCTLPICILTTLAILIALGVTAFFVLPRIPTVNIKNAIPASTPNLSTNPPFINMNFTMVIEIDNNKNYVAYKFNKIDVTVFDRTVADSSPIATGTKLDYTLLPKRINTIEFPLTVNYTTQTIDDPVLKNFINACSPEVRQHTPLKLRVDVVLFVWGIDWIYKPKVSVPIPDMKCPDVI